MTERHEAFIAALFAERYRVVLRRIPTSTEPTPDFEMVDGDERVAVVELKTLTYSPRTEENGWKVTRDGPTMKATRTDNAAARVGSLIYKAAKQLKDHATAKVLVILNLERLADVGDLHEAVEGPPVHLARLSESSPAIRISLGTTKVARGRVSETAHVPDLYFWVEPPKRGRLAFPAGGPPEYLEAETEDSVWIRVVSETGLRLAQRYFSAPADFEPLSFISDEA